MVQKVYVSANSAFYYLGQLSEYSETATMFGLPRIQQTEEYITGRFG